MTAHHKETDSGYSKMEHHVEAALKKHDYHGAQHEVDTYRHSHKNFNHKDMDRLNNDIHHHGFPNVDVIGGHGHSRIVSHQAHELSKQIQRDLKGHDAAGISRSEQALSNLKKHEDAGLFNNDLQYINHGLGKHHLPQIYDGGDGQWIVTGDNTAHSQGARAHGTVTGRSGPAPRESDQERQTYKKMGYDGWHGSSGGDGSAGNSRSPEMIPSADHEKLLRQALEISMGPQFDAMSPEQQQQLMNNLNLIVQKESGWNANSINLTDSNARAGHPSQGLMQTIPETFHRYAAQGYNSNINDPLSNLVAGINYANKRYGSINNVPGVKAVHAGRAYVGY